LFRYPEFAMTISMYQASAPRFVNILNNLSVILEKAQAYAEAKKIEPAQIDGTEEKEIVLKLGGREMKFKGMQYPHPLLVTRA
jgi:hypothetical protein